MHFGGIINESSFCRYLGVLHKEANESTEAFAERMRAEIASALTYKVSSFTASDKVREND